MQHSRVEGRQGFWRFSLALYARPGVAPALLDLQDRHGREVNLILWALWAGCVRGKRVTLADFEAAESATAELRKAAVEPLRGLRRRLKCSSDHELRQFRHLLATVELAAERRLQAELAALTAVAGEPGSAAKRLDAAEANLALYLGRDQDTSAAADTLRAAVAALLRR